MLNPAQDSNGDPGRVEDEYFVLHRKGVEFTVNFKDIKKFFGKGRLILTTCRLVLINEIEETGGMQALDLPFAITSEEKFTKPILGKSYWEGKCVPLSNGELRAFD